MDKIMSLLQNFDPAAFIPELNKVLGWIELGVRIAVLAGPLFMLALGLLYFLAPPKEANHRLGFKALWGMGSIEAWLFTQKIAGIIWSVLGFVLTIVMALIANGYRGMDAMEIVQSAAKSLMWQIGLIFASYVLINLVTIVIYDWKGRCRWKKDRQQAEDAEISEDSDEA